MDGAAAVRAVRKERHGILPALFAILSLTRCLGPDAPSNAFAQTPASPDSEYGVVPREPRIDSWAAKLAPITVKGPSAAASTSMRLYASTGEVDEAARAEFERVVAMGGEQHILAARLEQLVFKAAYQFKGADVDVVSGWRQHAGRHTAGEALDFKLQGVRAATLAAYLRGLARVGVGIYTHPRTQFVHLDVRDQSYHWLDASPPGVKWREKQLRDPHAAKRDESWTAESDLPL